MTVGMRGRLAAVALAGISSVALAACSSEGDGAARSPSSGGRPSYTDGRYTAKGWYGSLPSNIDVTLTLDDGVIRDVEVMPQATDPTSRDYQERFADAVPRVVEGRRIDEVELSRVAGSSGTPDGFNDALDRIEADAAR